VSKDKSIRAHIVGIDPGVTGAVAILHQEGNSVDAHVYPMPIISDEPWAKGRLVNTNVLTGIMGGYPSCTVIGIEHQHAVSKQGLASTFKTAFNYGAVVAAACWVGTALHWTAKEWQKVHKLTNAKKDKRKQLHIETAQRLYPDVSLMRTPRCKVPCHGMADALLIAEATRLLYLEEIAGCGN
jgi:hypothetical protein